MRTTVVSMIAGSRTTRRRHMKVEMLCVRCQLPYVIQRQCGLLTPPSSASDNAWPASNAQVTRHWLLVYCRAVRMHT